MSYIHFGSSSTTHIPLTRGLTTEHQLSKAIGPIIFCMPFTTQIILDDLHDHDEEGSTTEESDGHIDSEVEEMSSDDDTEMSERVDEHHPVLHSSFYYSRLHSTNAGRHVQSESELELESGWESSPDHHTRTVYCPQIAWTILSTDSTAVESGVQLATAIHELRQGQETHQWKAPRSLRITLS
jgi:hypothetical protein